MKSEAAAIAMLGLLAVQGFVVRNIAGAERLPPVPDLARFPMAAGPWRAYSDIAIPRATARELGADQVLERLYFHQATGVSADLFIAWFRSQRGGTTQPHSPKVCLPGAGWLPMETSRISLETQSGTIEANRYLIRNRGQRALVLYWYQTPRRVVAGELAAKFFTVADGLRDRRTDTAVVRIFVPATPAGGESEEAANLARAIYPLLREALPR